MASRVQEGGGGMGSSGSFARRTIKKSVAEGIKKDYPNKNKAPKKAREAVESLATKRVKNLKESGREFQASAKKYQGGGVTLYRPGVTVKPKPGGK